MCLFGQLVAGDNVTVEEKRDDDLYMAGDNLNVNAPIDGDLVAAGSDLYIRDTIMQDMIAAGSKIWLSGPVIDDGRLAASQITIDSEIGDDLIVFASGITITKDAIIHGNLIVFAGDVDIDGDIEGNAKIKAGKIKLNGSIGGDADLKTGDLWINGAIEGKTTMVADIAELGGNASFYGDVEYWTDEGEIDFGKSLKNVQASYSEDLIEQCENGTIGILSFATVGFWLFYVLSAFLLIVLLNLGLRNVFSLSALQLDQNLLKSLGYGLIYLVGVPIIVIVLMAIVVGIPTGLFFLFVYIFSLLFGHLFVALLATHYLNNRNEKSWNFWTISILALAVAIILRLITLIPFLGFFISVFIIAVTYGALGVSILEKRKGLQLQN